jgi:hypothetical protein
MYIKPSNRLKENTLTNGIVALNAKYALANVVAQTKLFSASPTLT